MGASDKQLKARWNEIRQHVESLPDFAAKEYMTEQLAAEMRCFAKAYIDSNVSLDAWWSHEEAKITLEQQLYEAINDKRFDDVSVIGGMLHFYEIINRS